MADLANPDESGLRKDPVLGIETVGAARILRLRGELDLYNAPRVREGLNDACAGDPEKVVIDLSQVEFVDSTSLGLVVEASRQLRDPRALILAGATGEVRRALDIAGFHRHFTVEGSVQEALDGEL